MNRRLMIYAFCTAATALATANACQNVLVPDVRVIMAPPPPNACGTYAFLGEFGARNVRGGATYGGYLAPNQLFKASGEYLTQILNYDFEPKHKNRWVTQFAFGGDYEYLFDEDDWLMSIDAGGAYSHAYSKPVGDVGRVAGSNGGFGYLGATVELWQEGYLSGAGNYDYVKYNRRHESDRTVAGWGGSVTFIQGLACDLSLQGTAEFRKPFNFYEASINWSPRYILGTMNFGIYANYTLGKHGLPNATTGGVTIGFAFGQCCGDKKASACEPHPVWDLSYWVSKPAVYVPAVLGIPDAAPSAAPAVAL